MQLHYFDDLADFRGESADWLGFILSIKQAGKARLRVNSARNWHLRVVFDKQPLLWAHMPELDYQVLRLYRQLPQQLELLPSMPAAYVYQAQALAQQAQRQHYLRWFAHQLQTRPNLCLRDGHAVLHWASQQDCPVHYLMRRRPCDWQAAMSQHERDFSLAVLLELDWGLCGNGSIVPLKASSPAGHGRLKWWRKQARQGKLPPILLWRIAALDVWLILDGHLRLQACLEEGIAPDYVLLDSYIEQRYASDTRAAQHIARQVELQAGRVAQGKASPQSLANMQAHLAAAFDDRPARRFVSYASAGLCVTVWQQEVDNFLQQHRDASWFQLD